MLRNILRIPVLAVVDHDSVALQVVPTTTGLCDRLRSDSGMYLVRFVRARDTGAPKTTAGQLDVSAHAPRRTKWTARPPLATDRALYPRG